MAINVLDYEGLKYYHQKILGLFSHKADSMHTHEEASEYIPGFMSPNDKKVISSIDKTYIKKNDITNISSKTEIGKYVVDATELNPDLEGTIGHQIKTLSDKLALDDDPTNSLSFKYTDRTQDLVNNFKSGVINYQSSLYTYGNLCILVIDLTYSSSSTSIVLGDYKDMDFLPKKSIVHNCVSNSGKPIYFYFDDKSKDGDIGVRHCDSTKTLGSDGIRLQLAYIR